MAESPRHDQAARQLARHEKQYLDAMLEPWLRRRVTLLFGTCTAKNTNAKTIDVQVEDGDAIVAGWGRQRLGAVVGKRVLLLSTRKGEYVVLDVVLS